MVFLNPEIRRICKKSFFKTAEDMNYLLAGFILMPEHVHIFSGTSDSGVTKEKMTKNYKGAASRRIFQEISGLKNDLKSKCFWTPKTDKQAIDNYYFFLRVMEYIVFNPIKKKLNPEQYFLFINPVFEKYLISIPQEFPSPQFIGGIGNSSHCADAENSNRHENN
ncbi:transposase [Patescibacteria group bacterium]|nr:transposase [Patescibacteria group bacterium]MBU1673092.1 transposase [Patescibacteria group bacterium]MBU1963698.1 transposase [Patescibacteria group bacterium]